MKWDRIISRGPTTDEIEPDLNHSGIKVKYYTTCEIVYYVKPSWFNPLTPALNCPRPTPDFLVFFEIFQSEWKHKNKPYAQ